MKKYIAFDYLAVQPTSFSPFHGGGKYGKIILQEILSRTDSVILFYSESLPHDGLIEIKKQHPHIILSNIDNSDKWLNVFSAYSVSKLYLPITFSKLYKKMSRVRIANLTIVGTIHGLRNLEAVPTIDSFRYRVSFKGFLRTLLEYVKGKCPGYLNRTRKVWQKLIEQKNYEYFVVSHHTQKTVKSFLPNQNPMVFYSPSVVAARKINEVRERYFLLVSGNRWEKNNLAVIRVLDELFSKEKLKDFYVKITGVNDLRSFRCKISNPEKFICVGYVSEDKFPLLYAKAYAFIYPSLSEGFGYPILEALSVQTPTIASNLTSIPEVGGDAVSYFNPYSKSDIEDKILKLLDREFYDALQDKALNQYERILKKQQDDLKKSVDFILK